jgi:hypothetical protein
MAIDLLAEAIDELFAAGPGSHGDGDFIVALQTQLARLDAFVATSAASFDAAGAWKPDGARSASAWISSQCRMPKRAAARQLARGRAVRRLPLLGQAWADGQISAAHVDVLAGVRTPATGAVLARDEELLVGQARSLPFHTFVQATRYWSQLADPDGAEESAATQRARRNVYVEQSFGGMWFGRMTLDPISGTIVSDELCRLERQLFESDWAEAKERLGREPKATELSRTSGQRRADALVGMAARSKVAPADGCRPAPLFSVLVDYDTVHGRICELANGTVVSPGSLVPWLDEALVERAVFTPCGRVEVGATARFFTGATRRALELRDRECAHPTCDIPAHRCEADHVVPYSEGGATTQANGRMACGFHNRLRNQRPRDGDGDGDGGGRAPPDW